MTKEHLIESYGTLRYTIGTGCSGGSLAQQWIANAYPGVYQGILPTCSFPDAWSTATQFLDYHLLLPYFHDPSKWGLRGRSGCRAQMADGRGPHLDRERRGLRDGAVPRRRPDGRLRRHHRRRALRPGDQPRRRPLLASSGRRDQHLRAQPAGALVAGGDRRSATASRCRRSTTSASSTGSTRSRTGQITPAPVRRSERQRSAASTSTPTPPRRRLSPIATGAGRTPTAAG